MMKQHFSSRLFLTATIALFACVSICAQTYYLNPFAYRLDNMVPRSGIQGTGNELLMNDHYIIQYALSGPADSVIVRFWDDATSTWSRDGGNTGTALAAIDITNETDALGKKCNAKGYHTYTLDFTHIVGVDASFSKVENKKLRWTIDVKGGNQQDPYTQRTCTIAHQRPTGNETTYPTYKFINAQKVTEDKGFRFPGSVDIDNNPYSFNFGAIFCTESYLQGTVTICTKCGKIVTPVSGKCPDHPTTEVTVMTKDDPSYFSYNKVPGVYVFGAGMEHLPAHWEDNWEIPCYGGGWEIDPMYFFPYYGTPFFAMSPHRVRLSDNGKVFVSAISGFVSTVPEKQKIISQIIQPSNEDENNFYEPMQDGGGYNHDIFTGGTWKESELIWNTSTGKFMLAPNVAMDVRGNWGKDFEMATVSATVQGSTYTPGSYLSGIYPGVNTSHSHANKYTFGTSTKWNNQEPSKDLIPNNTLTNKIVAIDKTPLGDGALVGFQNTSIEFDTLGGCWIVQNRGDHPVAATMIHYNAITNSIDYEEHAIRRSSGAVRHNHNFTKLAVAGGYPKDSLWSAGYKQGNVYHAYYGRALKGSCITIYDVEYNPSTGKYNFTDSMYIENANTNGAHDIAWDFADNLYVASTSTNKLFALALPHKNKTVSTPCRDPYEYKLSPVHEFAYEINPTVAGLTTPYATITHPRINREPYPRYLQNANVTLVADIVSGCKLYKWVENIFDKSTHINSNAADNLTNECVISSMVEKEKITAHIGLCVYEDTEVLDIQKATTFPAAFVKRELDNANYSTICLPFDLKTLEDTPWEGASVLKMNRVYPSGEVKEGEEQDLVTYIEFVELGFTEEEHDHIEAYYPYLIKLADDAENISATDEKIFLETHCPLPMNNRNSYGGFTDGSLPLSGVAFHGVLNPSTITNNANTLFLVADNRLATIVGPSTVNLKGLRAFFTVDPTKVPGKIQLRLPEKTVTSVPTFSIDTLKPTKYLWNGRIYIQRGNNVYDLSGNCVK